MDLVLAAAVITIEQGVSSPSHGLVVESWPDAVRKARTLYEMVEEARGV